MYAYDAFGNLRSVTLPNLTVVSYVTDGRHRRVAKKVNGTIVRQWLYQDSLRPAAELDGSGAVLSRYVYGSMSNSPNYVIRSNGAIYRVLRDQLGSPLLVVNVVNRSDVLLDASYSAFGKRTVNGGSATALGLGFAGGIYDEDTGLTRFGAWDYDAAVGRWTSKDPILWGGGQGNIYVYVGNDPVNFVDPEGQWALVVGGAILGAAYEAGLQMYATGSVNDWGEVGKTALIGAGLGGLASFAVGTAWAATSTTGELVAVTHWGGASPWVMLGGNTLRNFWMSGAVERYSRDSGVPTYVNRAQLSFPRGIEWFKGLFGQRIMCGE